MIDVTYLRTLVAVAASGLLSPMPIDRESSHQRKQREAQANALAKKQRVREQIRARRAAESTYNIKELKG